MNVSAKFDYGFEQIEAMPNGPEKAALWAMNGLGCDGGHHKQWYLCRVLEALGQDLSELREALNAMGYDFEEGVAP